MSDVLGLDRYMHEAYRVLLKQRECTTNDVADRLGISRPQAEQTLARLTAAGLAATTHTADSVQKTEAVVPLDPRRSLAPLLGRKQAQLAAQQQELARAHEAVASLAAAYSAGERGRRKDPPPRTDLSNGVRAVRTRIEELLTQAATSVVCVLGEDTGAVTLDVGDDLLRQTLDRGVTVKALYARRLVADQDVLSHVRELIAAGGQARTATVMPPPMMVVDNNVVLVPADGHRSAALVVRNRALAIALSGVFDHAWGRARVAIAARTAGAGETDDDRAPTSTELDLLHLLGKGMTDASAARHLGVSLRTVRRMMAELMNRLDARSRFEAGIRATEQGWVGMAGPLSATEPTRLSSAGSAGRRLVAG